MHSNDQHVRTGLPTGLNIDKMFSPGGIGRGGVPLRSRTGRPTGAESTWRVRSSRHKQPGYDNAHPGTRRDGLLLPHGRRHRGHRRPPDHHRPTALIAWERLQPTLLGALDSTYLGRITDVADACPANGVG